LVYWSEKEHWVDRIEGTRNGSNERQIGITSEERRGRVDEFVKPWVIV